MELRDDARQLGEKERPRHLLTVRGCGYRFVAKPCFYPKDVAEKDDTGCYGQRGIDMVTELKERMADVAERCQRFHVQELHLFGSSTSATSVSDVGDLDFLVRFEDMPPGLYSNSFFGLAEGLSALFGCRVDLVEENAIRNPFFREAVEAAVEAAKERIYSVA